jgi:hypothetical protein
MYERRLFNVSGRKWMIMNEEWNCQEGGRGSAWYRQYCHNYVIINRYIEIFSKSGEYGGSNTGYWEPDKECWKIAKWCSKAIFPQGDIQGSYL